MRKQNTRGEDRITCDYRSATVVQSTSVLLQSGPVYSSLVWFNPVQSSRRSAGSLLFSLPFCFIRQSHRHSSDNPSPPSLSQQTGSPVCTCECVRHTAGVNDCTGVKVDGLINGTVQCTFPFCFYILSVQISPEVLRVTGS